jgi:hypothetical protein
MSDIKISKVVEEIDDENKEGAFSYLSPYSTAKLRRREHSSVEEDRNKIAYYRIRISL